MPHSGRRPSDDAAAPSTEREAGTGSARSWHDARGPQAWRRGWGWGWDDGAVTGGWEPRFRMRGWATLWIPVILSFVVQVPAAVFRGRFRGLAEALDDDPLRFALRVALALAGPAALIAARRFPGPTVAVVTAAAGAYVLVISGDSAPPYIALPFALVGAVVRGARVWAWVALGAGWIATVTAGILIGVAWQPALVTAVTLGLVLCLAIGESIRTRRRRHDELRRRLAERRQTAAQAERVRIARELHDVLAHSLSQISVQAGVGLHLIDSQPQEAAKALADIKATSRAALEEVRSVLGVLRSDGARDGDGDGSGGGTGRNTAPLVPEPDLSRLAGLIDSVRSQGLHVEFDDGIGPDEAGRMSKAVQLALYRIVQESLTNVIRHSGAARATVVLSTTDGGCSVSVVDDGPPPGTAAAPGATPPGSTAPTPGRGLLGMRERAELLGGTFAAGPVPAGGFAVTVGIPFAPLTPETTT